MQAYSKNFAKVYNSRWTGFVREVAPLISDFYSETPAAGRNKSVLDLGCGTGQLATCFLEKGYEVVGIDSSKHMLQYAIENAGHFVNTGQAKFIQGNVADFIVDGEFGLVVSTFDTLNHLPDMDALIKCFNCVASVNTGYFIFDLNTRAGLHRWNNIHVDDSDEMLIITRGIYDGKSDRAWTKISGFIRMDDGHYERFDETAFNSAFNLDMVKDELIRAGWKDTYFAQIQDLSKPVDEPERLGRVFVVASR